MSEMKRVLSPADVPKTDHFQVIVYETRTIYHEGDERSRTHPGHGYPASTEEIQAFQQYITTDPLVLERFLLKLETSNSHGKSIYSATKVLAVLDVQLHTSVIVKENS